MKRAVGFLSPSAIWLLAAVVIIAAVVRAWGIDFGLPYIYHPDENVAVIIAQTMLKTGNLNPNFFHWPSLIFYLNAFAYGLYYLVGNLVGIFATPADFPYPTMLAMGTGHIQMPSIWLIGRLVTASFGVGSVILIFLCGRKLTDNSAVGILAALLLALSPTNVNNSRYITPDTFTVFFVLLSFYGSIGVFKEGRPRDYILAGLAIGLTASTKYNGALVAVALLAAHFLRHGIGGFKERTLYLAGIVSILAFLATTPYAVLDFPTFRADLQFDAQHYSTGHAGMEGDSLNWYLHYLWRVEGPVVAIAIAGATLGLIRRWQQMLLLATFPLLYFTLISSVVVRNDRTLLPMMPFLFLLTASFLVYTFRTVIRMKPIQGKLLAPTIIVFGGFLLIYPLLQTVEGASRLTTADGRETARLWIAENLPQGSQIALESYAPYVDPQTFTVEGFNSLKDQSLEWYLNSDLEYLIFSQGAYARFYAEPNRYASSVASYDYLFANLDLVKIFNDGGYEVRIYAVPK